MTSVLVIRCPATTGYRFTDSCNGLVVPAEVPSDFQERGPHLHPVSALYGSKLRSRPDPLIPGGCHDSRPDVCPLVSATNWKNTDRPSGL
jgi:hypothetical protein